MSQSDAEGPPASRRPPVLLLAGASVGIALGLFGLLQRPVGVQDLGPHVVARVGDVEIDVEGYGRAIGALARDRRTAVDDAERRRVLERLIDEELLVQRALELGVARMDRTLRAGLVDALIASITAEAQDVEPTRVELERFYDEQRDLFRQPGRVRVGALFIRAGDDEAAAAQRAATAHARIVAGESITRVSAALGDRPAAPVPDVLLPPTKLQEYVGPTALRAVLALEVGGVTRPVRAGGGYYVLALTERRAPVVPAFAEMEPTVRAEYRRRAGEQALADYLADLRARATIVRSDALP